MERVTLTIPAPPPPGINRQDTMHWAARARLRTRWRELAYGAWLEAGRPVIDRPEVTVTLYYSTRRHRDTDNAAAAIKPIIDGLKGHAWPGDDDAETITLLPIRMAVDAEHPRVEITLNRASGGGS